jgi:hypothetical protein
MVAEVRTMASPTIPFESPHATGPRTEEGKARSSQNSREHGLSAINLGVLPKEQAEFDTYQNELLDQIKPQAGLQADLFRQLVHAGWSLIRLERFELEILGEGNPFKSSEAQSRLDRLERYRASHRRAYSRILAEIRKLQTDALLWATTHNIIRTVLRDEFPMADPASRPLNNGIERISGGLDKRDFELPRNSASRPPAAPLYKTNSPEPASQFAALAPDQRVRNL